jgi:CelD/BcsL family acetyltransferase involved in cellulose biosynthesis
MSLKGKVSHLDEAKVQENLRLLRECGALCLATIDGKVCAGTTVFRIGDSVISRINAHDPKYDPYRLGILCGYLAVCAFIERGARRFHFGHTKYDYKVSLGGRFQAYEHIVIYRSRLHFLGKMHHAIRVAAEGYRVLLSRKLLESAESESGIFWDTTRKGLQLWRSLKKMTRRDSHIQSH